jgi:hypothetical protein
LIACFLPSRIPSFLPPFSIWPIGDTVNSPKAISTELRKGLPSFLPSSPSFLPSFLPSSFHLPSFFAFLPSFFLSFTNLPFSPSFLPSIPSFLLHLRL